MKKDTHTDVYKVFKNYKNTEENTEFDANIQEHLNDFKEEEKKRKKKEAELKKKQKKSSKKEKKIPFWADLLINIVILAVLLFIFRTFIFSPFNINGTSMEPTLANKEFMYVDKLIPMFSGYERGDVIVFLPPTDTINKDTGLMCLYHHAKNIVFAEGKADPCLVKSSFVKRIIGIPGDIVEITDGEVFITPKGGKKEKASVRFLSEKNKKSTCTPAEKCDFASAKKSKTYKVPIDSFFVLGDNRTRSSDSRSPQWDTAFVKKENIFGIGRAVFLSPKELPQDASILDKLIALPSGVENIRTISNEKIISEE